MQQAPPLSRRQLLSGLAAVTVTGLAGCSSLTAQAQNSTDEEIERVESLPVPIMGSLEADPVVTVSAYLDYSSALCRSYMNDVFPTIEGTYLTTGKVRYEHHDFPIPINRWSWDTAIAARAIQDHLDPEVPQTQAGMAHFWEFTKLAYEHQPTYSVDRLSSIADTVDRENTAGEFVEQAIEYEQYLPVVETSRYKGIKQGVRGPPTIVVNGEQVDPTTDALKEAIESELPEDN